VPNRGFHIAWVDAARNGSVRASTGLPWIERNALKFSYRQILASAGGAVLAATIASFFGVEGTVIGVAIGSIVATTGSAFLFQSIERTHDAVKQVVVRVPDRTGLLRRLGGTKAAGVTDAEPAASSALTEETASRGASADQGAEPMVAAAPVEPATESLPVNAPTEALPAAAPVAASAPLRNWRWPAVAGAVAGVFVLALLFVTVVELIAGRPLADLFGDNRGGGTTVERIFQSPTTTVAPTTSTTTTTSTTSSTTTTTSSTSTTTTVPGSTTSTTTPGSTSTTTPTPTTVPGTSTSTTAVTNAG
jgi:hypothetical protein